VAQCVDAKVVGHALRADGMHSDELKHDGAITDGAHRLACGLWNDVVRHGSANEVRQGSMHGLRHGLMHGLRHGSMHELPR